MEQPSASRRSVRHVRRSATAIGSVLFELATRAVRRAPRDLTITSAAALATLDRTGPRRVTDLAAIEGITQPAMSIAVRAMEQAGLVERRDDPSDRRVTLVALTESGRNYVTARHRKGVQAFAGLIDTLSDDEIESLTAALPALRHLAALESQTQEGSRP